MESGTAARPEASGVGEAGPQAPGGRGWRGADVQAAAAVVLVGIVLAAVWGAGMFSASSADAGKPAACNPATDTDSPEYPALCAALNRPDLPTLLGTPGEHVSIAQSGGGPIVHSDGTKEFDASAQVQIGPVNVRITHNHDLSVRDITGLRSLLAQPRTVLGHPAAVYRSTTIALIFKGGKASTGAGGTARNLAVAIGPDEDADTVEFSIWRQDDEAPDPDALLRIAEQVLPTVRGWLPATQDRTSGH
ncbi:DUF6215 domain-containing protein [Kitasatospora sp. DSM 101779]|uniref:DUF6215 domain-containing protein n=1 Tax=Kitasatospora sp. DSM 101779 TaxID=2853165 RepID=UPI0021D9B37F|nr:DUF6215 domain-containing protein [Kitasatospora sp. DSM 101779]MCU7826398.1 hypothetical protein [Kitasatospora sp. DSM 101779]